MLKTLASPRLTVLFFLLMAGAALWASQGAENITAVVLAPLLLLLLNLGAAIIGNARFRADLPLLVFHLALLLLLGLLAAARLTYFEGALTLSADTDFDGEFVREERGMLHGDGARRLRFGNEGFTENYPARGQYHMTYNLVRWSDAEGRPRLAEIGDDRPLVIDGYRIYATRQRGFSPVFAWVPADGAEQLGTIQLLDRGETVGSDDFPSGSTVTLPGGTQAWVQLRLQGAPEKKEQRADLGAAEVKHHVVLRVGSERHELQTGDSVALPGGRLHYVKLGSWMGYRVTYDPTKPWLIATTLVGILALVWFYSRLLLRPRREMQPIPEGA